MGIESSSGTKRGTSVGDLRSSSYGSAPNLSQDSLLAAGPSTIRHLSSLQQDEAELHTNRGVANFTVAERNNLSIGTSKQNENAASGLASLPSTLPWKNRQVCTASCTQIGGSYPAPSSKDGESGAVFGRRTGEVKVTAVNGSSIQQARGMGNLSEASAANSQTKITIVENPETKEKEFLPVL